MQKRVTILTIIFILIMSSNALAYEYFSYKFTTGITEARYSNLASDDFDQEGTIYDFETLYHQVMNAWKNLTEADIRDSVDYPNHGPIILGLWALDYGELGLNGWARMYDGPTPVSGSYGSSGPTQSYNYCNSYLNAHDIQDDGAMSFLEARTIGYHEVGHCLGLAHEDDGTPAIMASGETAIDNGWLNIQTDDINGVNNRY